MPSEKVSCLPRAAGEAPLDQPRQDFAEEGDVVLRLGNARGPLDAEAAQLAAQVGQGPVLQAAR